MIIIETGFPRERANCNNRTALRLRRSDGLRDRGGEERSHKPLNFLNPSHRRPMSVWGPKRGFIYGRHTRGRRVDTHVRRASLRLPIRNQGGDSAAKRREEGKKGSSVISCSVKPNLTSTLSPVLLLSMPPPPPLGKSQLASLGIWEINRD